MTYNTFRLKCYWIQKFIYLICIFSALTLNIGWMFDKHAATLCYYLNKIQCKHYNPYFVHARKSWKFCFLNLDSFTCPRCFTYNGSTPKFFYRCTCCDIPLCLPHFLGHSSVMAYNIVGKTINYITYLASSYKCTETSYYPEKEEVLINCTSIQYSSKIYIMGGKETLQSFWSKINENKELIRAFELVREFGSKKLQYSILFNGTHIFNWMHNRRGAKMYSGLSNQFECLGAWRTLTWACRATNHISYEL